MVQQQVFFYKPDVSLGDIFFCLWKKNSRTELLGELRDFFGTRNVVLTGSGRCALKLALQELKISRGDEIILPPFICPSVGDAILEAGGIPVFGDNDPCSLNMSPESAEEAVSERTKAIVIAHIGGIPARIQRFKEIAKKNNIPLIEDCAQSFGAKYDGIFTGLHGDYAFTSFGFSKNINGIGGGALFSHTRILSDPSGDLHNGSLKLRMKKHAMLLSIPWVFGERSGFFFKRMVDTISRNNYHTENFHEYCRNIENIESGLALRKLRMFSSIQGTRNTNARIYYQNLRGVVDLISLEKSAEPAFLYYPLLLKDKTQVKKMKSRLSESKIQSKDKEDMRFFALWKNQKFKRFRHVGENILDIEDRYILLPVGHDPEITERICNTIIRNS